MRIYLRTPLVNKSKMIPHLVEHCIWHSVLILEDFFEFSYWLDGVISTDYTYFEYDKWVDYQEAIKRLTINITEEVFLYERDIIKQELEDVGYDKKIYEYVVRKYLDSYFFMNKFEIVSFGKIEDYHKKYYTPENMIVVDDDFKIIKEWFKAGNINKSQTNKTLKDSLVFENDKYLVYIWKKTDWTWYWEMYFSFRVLCFFWTYSQRWQKWEYYYLEPYFYEYKDNCIVITWDYDYSQLDEKFFELWKKYIINMFKSWYFKERFFLNKYIYWISKTREEVIQICNKFSRDNFRGLLGLK